MMPNSGTGTGTFTARLGPGGFTVLMDLQDKTAMGTSSGHGMVTWDPTEKAYGFVWVSSDTPGFQILTGHKEGDNLVFTAQPVLMGKKGGSEGRDRQSHSHIVYLHNLYERRFR
jgi:hypothetical protein